MYNIAFVLIAHILLVFLVQFVFLDTQRHFGSDNFDVLLKCENEWETFCSRTVDLIASGNVMLRVNSQPLFISFPPCSLTRSNGAGSTDLKPDAEKILVRTKQVALDFPDIFISDSCRQSRWSTIYYFLTHYLYHYHHVLNLGQKEN